MKSSLLFTITASSVLLLFCATFVDAFVAHKNAPAPAPATTTIGRNKKQRQSLTPLQMDPAMIQDMETARIAFALCFFGAIGSAAVGREVIPVTWREYQKLSQMKGKGAATIGGTDLNLFGYPEPVYTEDVVKVLNNNMTVYEMVKQYPVVGQLPGYLRFESLAQANTDTSQVAVRAVFDSVALGMNKNSVDPRKAAEKLELYKLEAESGLPTMKSNIQLNKTLGAVALVLLLSVIGAADYFSLFHLFHGWFPEWGGTSRLPASLLDFGSLTTLPNYFINDVPTMPTAASDAFPMN